MTITAKFNGKCGRCHHAMPAGSPINWVRGEAATHVSPADCEAAIAAAFTAPAPVVNLKAVADFLTAAAGRGLKSPKLRVLGPRQQGSGEYQGQQELRLGLTKGGVVPGSISVVEGGTFIGCVRPTGEVTGELAGRADVQAVLLAVTVDPVKAAKDYAQLTGRCCFCALLLTDAGSTEVGYGPICAAKWGLPHKPQGTTVLAPAAV